MTGNILVFGCFFYHAFVVFWWSHAFLFPFPSSLPLFFCFKFLENTSMRIYLSIVPRKLRNLNLSRSIKSLVYQATFFFIKYEKVTWFLFCSCAACFLLAWIRKWPSLAFVFFLSKFSVCWCQGAEQNYNSQSVISPGSLVNKVCVWSCVRGKWSQIWVCSSDVARFSGSCYGLPYSHLPVNLHHLRQIKLSSPRQSDVLDTCN